MKLTIVLLILLNIIVVLSSTNTDSFLHNIFPRFSRCWFITSENGNFNNFILKSFNQELNPIYTVGLNEIDSSNSKLCDGFIFIFKNTDGMFSFMKKRNDVVFLANTKVIIFYFGDEDYKSNPQIVQSLHDKAINVVYIRAFTTREIILPNYRKRDLDSLTLFIHAPYIHKKLTVSIHDNLSEVNQIETLFKEQKWRPNFHTSYNKTFRIGLFHCPPFIVKNGDRYDGLEYKMIKEITKGWNIEHIEKGFSKDIHDPWTNLKKVLVNRTIDLATCSIWLDYEKWLTFDMTYPYSLLCGTFLVPRPVPVSSEKFMYLPLHVDVWVAFIVSIFISSVVLNIVTKLGQITTHVEWSRSSYRNLILCFIEILNSATSHGVTYFPQHPALRFILVSWMILCLIISTSYSTGVASLLTSPRYTRKLDTFKDMYEDDDLFWGHNYNNTGLGIRLRLSHVPYASIFLQREYPETEEDNREKRILENNYAIFVKVLDDKYVTEIEYFKNVANKLRLMKQCVSDFFIVLGLQKDSPYLEIFNTKVVKMIEGGIISHWVSIGVPIKEQIYQKQFFYHHDSLIGEPAATKISDLRGSFLLLFIGNILALITFLIELAISLYYKRKIRKKIKFKKSKNPTFISYSN